MKRLLAASFLLLASGMAHGAEAVYGDLFPYENKASSFTLDVDMLNYDRASIQVVYSTPTINDASIDSTRINTADDTIYVGSHGYATALPVLLSTAGQISPNPLKTGTTYYVVKVTDNLIKLATTYSQATSNDPINILATSSMTLTLRPVPLNLNSAGFLWYGSNDGANWVGVSAVGFTVATSTQQLAAMGANGGARLLDWGEFAYRYLRFDFKGPASGIIKLRAYINAKRRS
jgi:hypothetical protein